MLLYIIRHGETDLNKSGKLQGQADIPLNRNGIMLAEITSDHLKNVRFDSVISSTLSRAIQTAKIILRNRDVPITFDPRINEINWGEWDGLCALKEHFEIPRSDFHEFYTDPYHFKGAPGGETIPQVIERTKSFFNDLINNPSLQEQTILISAHGCSVRGILNNVYKDKTDFWHGHVPLNCAVNIVKINNGQSSLVTDDCTYYDDQYKVNYYH